MIIVRVMTLQCCVLALANIPVSLWKNTCVSLEVKIKLIWKNCKSTLSKTVMWKVNIRTALWKQEQGSCTAWSSGWQPCPGQGVGTKCSLRSLPIQAFLWYYGIQSPAASLEISGISMLLEQVCSVQARKTSIFPWKCWIYTCSTVSGCQRSSPISCSTFQAHKGLTWEGVQHCKSNLFCSY